MPAASTSAVALRYLKESTWGVPVASNFQNLSFTGETLSSNSVYTRSNVIRDDGQTPSVTRTDAKGGGTVNGELQGGAWDEWFEFALLSRTWPAVTPVTTTDISATAASGSAPTATFGKLTKASGWGVAIVQGCWIITSGFVNGGNNGFFKVVAKVTNDIFVTGQTIVTEAAGPSITVSRVQDVMNGKTVNSFSLERQYTDDTDEFEVYLGCSVASMSVEFPTADLITTSFDLISQTPVSATTTIGGTPVAAVTNETMASANVLKVLIGDPQLGVTTATSSLNWDTSPYKLLQASLRISPSLRERPAIGGIGPQLSPGRGDMVASGRIRLYYNNTAGKDDKTLINHVLLGTVSGLAIIVTGSAKYYIFDFPRIKWTSGTRNAPAKSQDVILEMSFEAYLHPNDTNDNANVTGVTCRIARI